MRHDRAADREKRPGPARPALKRRDVAALILAAYRTSFPYFLLIVLVLVIVTWLLTEVIFTS